MVVVAVAADVFDIVVDVDVVIVVVVAIDVAVVDDGVVVAVVAVVDDVVLLMLLLLLSNERSWKRGSRHNFLLDSDILMRLRRFFSKDGTHSVFFRSSIHCLATRTNEVPKNATLWR